MPKGITPGTRELRVMVKVPEDVAASVQSLVHVGEKRASGMGITSFAVHDIPPDRAMELVKADVLRYSDLKPEQVEVEIDYIQRVSAYHVITPEGTFLMPDWIWKTFRKLFKPADPTINPPVEGPIKYSEHLYYIPKIGFEQAWNQGFYGNDVLVGVNDTGCGPAKHVPFVSNLNTVGFDEPQFEQDNDNNGHGTHVAGTIGAISACDKGIVGAAPKCKLRIYKSGEGYFYTSDLIQALEAAVAHNVAILNNSWGGSYSKFMQKAITTAFNKGTLIVKAVGNEATKCPDQYKDCVMVSAINQFDNPSKYTNSVTKDYVGNTIATYGDDILSHVPNEKTDFYSGTSMATPIVTSALAILKQKYPNYGPKELLNHLMSKCVVPLKSQKYGLGKLSMLEEFKDAKGS